jgi:hypothetical protein
MLYVVNYILRLIKGGVMPNFTTLTSMVNTIRISFSGLWVGRTHEEEDPGLVMVEREIRPASKFAVVGGLTMGPPTLVELRDDPELVEENDVCCSGCIISSFW